MLPVLPNKVRFFLYIILMTYNLSERELINVLAVCNLCRSNRVVMLTSMICLRDHQAVRIRRSVSMEVMLK